MKEIIQLLNQLALSPDAPVRANLAANLKVGESDEFLMRSWANCVSEGLSLLRVLCKDRMDSVRINCPESVVYQAVDNRVVLHDRDFLAGDLADTQGAAGGPELASEILLSASDQRDLPVCWQRKV